MAILAAKVHGNEIAEFKNISDLPVHHLGPLSLKALVTVLPLLGRLKLGDSHLEHTSLELVDAAASTLANWPLNFHACLRESNAHSPTAAFGLIKHFESFYWALRKRSKAEPGLSFLREEFIRFGKQSWGEGVVDTKFYSNNTKDPARFISQLELARRLRVSKATLRNWSDQGLIELKKIRCGCQIRYVADSDKFPWIEKARGTCFEERPAAALLLIPVSVLRHIRNSPHYPAVHSPPQMRGYDEQDLQLLKTKLACASPLMSSEELPKKGVVALSYILQKMKFKSKDGKFQFVVDYLNGKFKSIGRTGDSTDQIWFLYRYVKDYAERYRNRTLGIGFSLTGAAFKLDCDSPTVSKLVGTKYLKNLEGKRPYQICSDSLNTFVDEYVSTIRIAQSFVTKTSRINKICDAEEFVALNVFSSVKQRCVFIKRQRLDELYETVMRYLALTRRGRLRIESFIQTNDGKLESKT